MQYNDHETESIIILPDPVATTNIIKYDRCCLWGNERISECGPTPRRENSELPKLSNL